MWLAPWSHPVCGYGPRHQPGFGPRSGRVRNQGTGREAPAAPAGQPHGGRDCFARVRLKPGRGMGQDVDHLFGASAVGVLIGRRITVALGAQFIRRLLRPQQHPPVIHAPVQYDHPSTPGSGSHTGRTPPSPEVLRIMDTGARPRPPSTRRRPRWTRHVSLLPSTACQRRRNSDPGSPMWS